MSVRRITYLVFAAVFIFSEEAHVTAIAEYVELAHVVQQAAFIVVAKRESNGALDSKVAPNDTEPVESFLIIEILKGAGASIKKHSRIQAFGANGDLFDEIAEMSRRGDPVPFPNIPTYKSSLGAVEFSKKIEMILFLSQDGKGRIKFTTDGSYEAIDAKSKIMALVKAGTTHPKRSN
jgi:hypothetical protein